MEERLMNFREGSVDRNVFDEVITRNSYRVPERFPPNAVVIDIGAHIGCFSVLCAQRGASKVLAFELMPENYEIAKGHLAQFPQVELFNKAVWTSDGEKVGHSGMFM